MSNIAISFLSQLLSNKVKCDFITKAGTTHGVITTFIEEDSCIVVNKNVLLNTLDIISIIAHDWEYISDAESELKFDSEVLTRIKNVPAEWGVDVKPLSLKETDNINRVLEARHDGKSINEILIILYDSGVVADFTFLLPILQQGSSMWNNSIKLEEEKKIARVVGIDHAAKTFILDVSNRVYEMAIVAQVNSPGLLNWSMFKEVQLIPPLVTGTTAVPIEVYLQQLKLNCTSCNIQFEDDSTLVGVQIGHVNTQSGYEIFHAGKDGDFTSWYKLGSVKSVFQFGNQWLR